MQDGDSTRSQFNAELEELRRRADALEQGRDALKQQVKTLTDECYQLRTLIDQLPDYIFIKDLDSRFVINNQAHIELLGFSKPEDVAGKTDAELFPKELAEQYYADEQELMRTGESLIGREEEVISKTGQHQWVSTNKVPLRDPDGNIIGLAGMSRDITARKEAEEALGQAFSELEKFTYMVGYEMHGPLRDIVQELEALELRLSGRIGEVSSGIIGRATDAAQRVRKLNRDLRTYSRVETWGSMPEPTDSALVVEHALEAVSERIEKHQAEVTHDELPTVMADPAQMLTLFQNLVVNSIDYRSDEAPRIHISAEPEGDMWRFAVQDNGIGIAPEDAERVFNIFEQLHTNDDHPGKGMGLAICRKIVKHHGGRIWVESQPGEGATFYFTLPGV
jgi:PAS domain S-box-containing protein